MNLEQLQKMTVKDLRQLAADHGIPNRSKLRKAELISALAATTKAAPPVQDSPALPMPDTQATSSPLSPAPSPTENKEADPGLPIPSTYGQDRLKLMVQDPQHVFAYWELTGDALDHARSALGESGAPVLVIDGGFGSEQRDIDLSGGNYYITVGPDTTYHAQLALRGSDGRLITIVAAEPVTTPAQAPSERMDEEWMAVDETFSELLAHAGLPGATVGASETLSARSRIEARLWQETSVSPLSSGELASPLGGSSPLGSHSVGSHTLASFRP